MTFHRFSALIAVSALLTGCQPAAPEFTASNAQVVRALFDSVIVDLRTRDWDTWVSRFDETARFHPAHAPAVVGHDGLRALIESLPPIETVEFSNVEVWGEGNLAYATSAIAIQFQGQPLDTQKQLVVFRRDAADAWKVQAVSINSDLPLP